MESSQSGIEAKVVEQRDGSGKVLARLRITPGTRSGAFHFEVEDFQQRIPVRAIGTGRIAETEVLVQIVEPRRGTQLGLRAKANGGRSAESRITLSLDRLSFDLIMDEKVRTLMNELQGLIASGASDARLSRLARQLDSALQITTGYRPFIEQVKNSAAVDILTITRSLIATVPPEEVRQNLALQIIGSAVKLFAPSPRRDGMISQKGIDGGRIIRVSPRENLVRPLVNLSIKLHSAQPPCIQIYQDCMNYLMCGGYGQPIDALCWLACATVYVICEII